MQGWAKLQNSFSGLDLGASAGKLSKGFNSSLQATKERLGQVNADEITELPQGVNKQVSYFKILLKSHYQNIRIWKRVSML